MDYYVLNVIKGILLKVRIYMTFVIALPPAINRAIKVKQVLNNTALNKPHVGR